MQCPSCESEDTFVHDSRPVKDGSTRRRCECKSCLTRFTTYEFAKPLKQDMYVLLRAKKGNKKDAAVEFQSCENMVFMNAFDTEEVKRSLDLLTNVLGMNYD